MADALSRVQGAELLTLAVSSITSNVLDHIKASYHLDNNLQQVITQLDQGQKVSHYSLQEAFSGREEVLLWGLI